MFSGISWYGYLSFLVVVVSAYYLLVFIIFYRKDINLWVNKFKGVDTRNSFLIDHMQDATVVGGNDALENLQRDIVQTLNEGVNRQLIEQEIIMTLEGLLTNYKDYILPQHREKINEYIIHECKNICSIHLDEEKAVSLWLSKG